MTTKPRRLGRGLSSLIQTDTPVHIEQYTNKSPTNASADDMGSSTEIASGEGGDAGAPGLHLVPLAKIEPSPFQARRDFDSAAIERLAASIRRSGLMQPIILRARRGGGYELVAGERRWRAAALAGVDRLPALVRELDDEQAAEWGLVENLQREDLNPMERAHGLRAMSERFALSHAELGERIGLDRSTVANLVRLTELEPEIQAMVGEGKLSMGHARALLAAEAGGQRLRLAGRVAEQAWSVRRIEEHLRESSSREASGETGANGGQTQREAVIRDLEKRLAAHLGTKAHIRMQARGNRGKLVIDFFSLEHFEDLMQRIGLSDTSDT